MKVIVNVANEWISGSEWLECEAVRLVENEDGSFDLWISKDIDAARAVDRMRKA